jgi:hypothetical protein
MLNNSGGKKQAYEDVQAVGHLRSCVVKSANCRPTLIFLGIAASIFRVQKLMAHIR